MSKVPNNLVRELQNTKKLFLQKTVNTKIGEMLCKNYTDDGFKKMPEKVISLQCSWVKRLFGDSVHE